MRRARRLGLVSALVLAACSPRPAERPAEATAASSSTASAAGDASSTAASPTPALPASSVCTDYRTEPEPGDMVMIYHAVSGLAPARDSWAEAILGKFDRRGDPEGAWKQANDQIAAQYAAVAATRCITLRTEAGVRPYDKARGGLVVSALGPDTYYPFEALGERVRLKIRNAEAASIWPLPPDRAEALMRGGANLYGVQVVARLRIVSARPSSGDGVIEADVDSFDIVNGRDAAKLATVAVAKQP